MLQQHGLLVLIGLEFEMVLSAREDEIQLCIDRCFFLGVFAEKICAAVQKERMEAEDMYVLSDNGSVLSAPSPKPYPHKPPKCTDCDQLFMKVTLVSRYSNYCIFWVMKSLYAHYSFEISQYYVTY